MPVTYDAYLMSRFTFSRLLFGRQTDGWKDTVYTVVKYGSMAYVVRTYGVGATFVSLQLN